VTLRPTPDVLRSRHPAATPENVGPPTLARRRARGVGKGHGPRRLAICRVTTAALRELARLLRVRNPIDTEISQIIHRPMTAGHAGEWIAAHVFDIELSSRMPRWPPMTAISARGLWLARP
jgi:hypothetical protein